MGRSHKLVVAAALVIAGRAQAAGYTVGNFGIAAEFGTRAPLIPKLLYNPAQFGPWLQELGSADVLLSVDGGAEISVADLAAARVDGGQARFPFWSKRVEERALDRGVRALLRAFAPISPINPATGFFPVVVLELRVSNPSSSRVRVNARLAITPAAAATTFTRKRIGQDDVIDSGSLFAAASPGALTLPTEAGEPSPTTSAYGEVTLEPFGTTQLLMLIGRFDAQGAYVAPTLKTSRDLLDKAMIDGGDWGQAVEDFERVLPTIGDPAIDAYSRAYLSAAVFLTRGVRAGEVITMGYSELNQRDSFWTSWLHLVLWPDLEKKMLRESMAGQLATGRVPTTLYPVIDRRDDIDITEYFALRIARYYGWHRDRAFMTKGWPAFDKAVAYLATRDPEGIGMPRQESFWADWKDVPGVTGRLYAPHFDLLWSAVLSQGARLARELGKPAATIKRYDDLLARADAAINRDVSAGGLWAGTHYADRWADRRSTPYVLQDQVIGGFFGAIPEARLPLVLDKLARGEGAYGVRETYPYITRGFEQPHDLGPGNYHNGGVWPWLNFVEATVRYQAGRAADAERLLAKIGRADLVASGDGTPSEYMNGETGENLGLPIQGWNGAIFATLYQGALGIERVSDDLVRVRPRLGTARDFGTWVVLPRGRFWLERKDGVVSVVKDEGLVDQIEIVE